jgi:hypothetical protein
MVGLPAYVSRAESEVKEVETQLLNAQNEKQKAIAWFNSLLNRQMQETSSLRKCLYRSPLQKPCRNL